MNEYVLLCLGKLIKDTHSHFSNKIRCFPSLIANPVKVSLCTRNKPCYMYKRIPKSLLGINRLKLL